MSYPDRGRSHPGKIPPKEFSQSALKTFERNTEAYGQMVQTWFEGITALLPEPGDGMPSAGLLTGDNEAKRIIDYPLRIFK